MKILQDAEQEDREEEIHLMHVNVLNAGMNRKKHAECHAGI